MFLLKDLKPLESHPQSETYSILTFLLSCPDFLIFTSLNLNVITILIGLHL